ncbi:SMI1/KNR4 family protein [Hydrocarboniphaga sp.]|uniref:SMI1/KNR4 family protein n=1 Tax=Hydrocarboniphaga sp. TaxID=2033016 RepID=UPI00260538A6|nr:SMI1/KNR4 family protein [Hydrocarboniphaga sp.]
MMEYQLNEPATEESLKMLRQQYPLLPQEYFAFLQSSDGGEGFLGIRPGYFRLWPASDVAKFSMEYELQIYAPEYLAVGSSGGGELFVFPISGQPAGIFMVPAIGMALDTVRLVASEFNQFVAAFGGDLS